MITFKHPPRHRDPNESPLLITEVEYVPRQSLRYYLKNAKLMWLRDKHTIINPKTRVPMRLAHIPRDGEEFRFIRGGGGSV